jgi:hypothetical protein
MREKSAVLLDISDPPAQKYSGLRANVSVADSDLSTQRLDEPVEAAKKRCLSRPAFTNERHGPSGWDVNANVIQRDYRPEAM